MRRLGFTLIELLVVLAAVGLLLSLAAPRYVEHIDRAREAGLRHNLLSIREALDRFQADKGRAANDLSELVASRYLREMPWDPVTERRDTWQLVRGSDANGGVVDVKSGAAGRATDGSSYASW